MKLKYLALYSTTLFLINAASAQEIKDKGSYVASVKSYNYNGWKINKDDSVNLSYGAKSRVLSMAKYARNGNSAVYATLSVSSGKKEVDIDQAIYDSLIIPPLGTPITEPIYQQSTNFKKGEYTASNGISYKVGDKIKIGKGSGPAGRYNYINQVGLWGILLYDGTSIDHPELSLPKGYFGAEFEIIKIVRNRFPGQIRYSARIATGAGRYDIWIEEALSSCEIGDCSSAATTTTIINQQLSPADEILKYKKLLDVGAISQQEYDAKKKELLNK